MPRNKYSCPQIISEEITAQRGQVANARLSEASAGARPTRHAASPEPFTCSSADQERGPRRSQPWARPVTNPRPGETPLALISLPNPRERLTVVNYGAQNPWGKILLRAETADVPEKHGGVGVCGCGCVCVCVNYTAHGKPLFFPLFFGHHPEAYGVPRPGIGSELQLWQGQILNPRCQARD